MFAYKLNDRAELRLIEPGHADAIVELIERNRGRLAPWMTFMDHEVSPEVERDFARTALGQFADGVGIHLGIWYDGVLAGGVGGSIDNRQRTADIGYWLGAEFEGMGLVTDSARVLVNYMMQAMGANRVVIRAAVENRRSRAVAERLGFVNEGVARETLCVMGQIQDLVIYSMLARDWEATPLPPAMFIHRLDPDSELSIREHRHAIETFELVERNREHIAEWLPFPDDTHGVEDTAAIIKVQLRSFAEMGNISAAIWHKGRLAGIISLTSIHWYNMTAEIGYWVSKEAEGKGLVTKAARALLDHGFGTLGLNRVIIRAEPENKRSWAVPERLGFKHEGRLRQVAKFRDRFVDHELYSILKDEWQQ